jgi:hypothetical protein
MTEKQDTYRNIDIRPNFRLSFTKLQPGMGLKLHFIEAKGISALRNFASRLPNKE